MKLFCEHDWSVLYEKYIKSPLERAIDSGLTQMNGDANVCYGTQIVVLICTKCGKVKELVEKV